MAGTVTATYDAGLSNPVNGAPIHYVTIAWTSTSGGAADITLASISGWIIKGVTVPAGGGSAPTDNYDIDITDANSVNILSNCKTGLHDRDTANTEEVYFFVLNQDATALSTGCSPVVSGALTVSITNAGNAKSGTLILYYCPG